MSARSEDGVAAQLVERAWLSDDILLCRFRCSDAAGAFSRFEPGQHVDISAWTLGAWVHRPYTLTSAPDDPYIREVIIRVHRHGSMGRFLPTARLPADVVLGRPRGAAFDGFRRTKPIVFLVAGVGFTTALAAAHASARGTLDVARVVVSLHSPSTRLVSLLWSRFREAGVELLVHDTERQGRLGRDAIAALVSEHRASNWFVCGPTDFMADMESYLLSAGVRQSRVSREPFARSIPLDAPAPARPRTTQERIWTQVALALVALWLVQSLLPPIPALEDTLGSFEARVWTGGTVLAVLAWQCLLPHRRLSADFTRDRQTELSHRMIGALAMVPFFLHTRSFGYGILAALGGLFLANVVIGALDKTIIVDPSARERWQRVWLPLHVTVALSVVALALWHVQLVVVYAGRAP